MRAPTRGRTHAKTAWLSEVEYVLGENGATELTPGFEWSRRIIILEAFSSEDGQHLLALGSGTHSAGLDKHEYGLLTFPARRL
jgi:hypothetical protein